MNLKQFRKGLKQLGSWRQFAFLLALAERGYPNFALFADIVDGAHRTRFRELLDTAWSMLERKDHGQDVFRLLTRLESVQPDPEAHDFYGVIPALNAWQLLEQAFLCHVNEDKERCEPGAQLAMDTVVSFVEMTEGEGLDEDALVRLLDDNELVEIEQNFQQMLVKELQGCRKPSPGFIDHIRGMAANRGVSNLGLEADSGA